MATATPPKDCVNGDPPFPFYRLPPELRLSVWQQYCPDLTGRPRVLDFYMEFLDLAKAPPYPAKRIFSSVYAGRGLAHTTQRVRNVLAVHGESRTWALAAFPDSLSMHLSHSSNDLVAVHFHKDRDVVMLSESTRTTLAAFERYSDEEGWEDAVASARLPGFHNHVVNLAVDFYKLPRRTTPSWLRAFSTLERTLIFAHKGRGPFKQKTEAFRRLTSKYSNQYTLQIPDANSNPEFDDSHIVAYWPDFLRHGECAEGMRKLSKKLMKELEMSIWPMVLVKSPKDWIYHISTYENHTSTV